MYWFGEEIENNNEWLAESMWKDLDQKRSELFKTDLSSILRVLETLKAQWQPGSSYFKAAMEILNAESGLTPAQNQKTLALLPTLLDREALEERLTSEFGRMEVLDKFTKGRASLGKVKAIPRGLLLHVTAGNVFLSSIDSLIMGFLTKNISILKVSSQNKSFPLLFARSLQENDWEKILSDKFAVVHWKGGDRKTEDFIKTKVKTIMAWGGEEMLASYRENLPSDVKLLDFGPKISFQVISKKSLEGKELSKVAKAVAQDIIPWDQAACSSPQNLFLEEGIDEKNFLALVQDALETAPGRSDISEDEATEILKERYRALYSELMEGGLLLEGKEHLLHVEKNIFLRPSPLNRSLIVKRFRGIDELLKGLKPFGYYLQSCSYLLADSEKEQYLDSLALVGIKRFAPLGTVTWGMNGAPHDGRYVLRELVDFIPDETRVYDYGEMSSGLSDSKALKEEFNSGEHPKGYIFSSGGTTGEPKYVHFSYEEFDFMTDMLATNLKRQGIKPGMTVANLFVAGNLWSSFMAVEKALEKIGAVQLPIGGLCSPENILLYLKKFKPQVVMGIPSMLVMNAEFIRSKGEDLEIERVFYAGEALSDLRRDYLSSVWKTKYFGSAGYASVDAGVMAYQCEQCGPGEHHVFTDQVEIKIVNDEAVVSSLSRDSLKIQNYRTGDRIEWIDDCACGRKDRRFKLLGRVDNLIQIWSCRLRLEDIEQSLSDLGVLTYQVVVEETPEERLKILYEISSSEMDKVRLAKLIYDRSRDLKDTLTLQEFTKALAVQTVPTGKIPRNPRTGKISLFVDQRVIGKSSQSSKRATGIGSLPQEIPSFTLS